MLFSRPLALSLNGWFSTWWESIQLFITWMTFCALALPLPIYVGFCWLRYLAERFGIPLAADKTEGPTSSIKFLGIVIDSQAMECHLPDDKLLSLKEEVRLVFGKHKIQLRELQSLLGKLNFACRIMPMGRVFFFWKLSMVGHYGWRGQSAIMISSFFRMSPAPLAMEHF